MTKCLLGTSSQVYFKPQDLRKITIARGTNRVLLSVQSVWLLQSKNDGSRLQTMSSLAFSVGTAAGARLIEINIERPSVLRLWNGIWYLFHLLTHSYLLRPPCSCSPLTDELSSLLSFSSGWLNHVFWPGGLFRVQDLVTAPFSQSGFAQSGVAGAMES